MNKQIVRIAAIVALALAVTLPTFAKDPKTPPVEGTITAVDATANTITVKTADGDKTIKTDTNTKVRIPKNKGATLADLKSGTAVTVKCKNDVAVMISACGCKQGNK